MRNPVLFRSLSLLGSVAVLAAPTRLSDPIGVFAVIDRVVLEPDAANARNIQIWGTFAVANRNTRNDYLPAERGYLYYTLPSTNSRAALAEWSDLRSVAGTQQAIGFGHRYEGVARIRRASDEPRSPDPYALGFGLVKVMTAGARPSVAYEVQRVPLPLTPADGARVGGGTVRLVTRNVADSGVQYIFEIEGPGNVRETSTPQPAGQNETTWSPRLRLKNGASYTWRVWVVKDKWQGQPAAASFHASE
jgi:hypothetical protein